jgi:quercetin dioxygenase-like cupin family protein
MPIIEHNAQPTSATEVFARVRPLVTKEHGAVSLTVQEVVMNPGLTTPLQTHATDVAFMMLEGSIQMIVGDEVRTVRSGHTLLAPPHVPYKLVNNTWVSARMLMVYPAAHLETKVLE